MRLSEIENALRILSENRLLTDGELEAIIRRFERTAYNMMRQEQTVTDSLTRMQAYPNSLR